jgi:UDP-N-acetylglucosamine 2-epimerase (non-hydrolysing)
MVTDSITDYFFTTTRWASSNLVKAGIDENRIYLVGNVMIDTLLANIDRFVKPTIYDELNLQEKGYIMLTLHRPANVDETNHLKALMTEIVENAKGLPIIFPIHPRTAKLFAELGIEAPNLHIVSPMGYLEFNYMVKRALAVVTDSGGITEETTVMGVPCITLRDNTERPETCEIGTNELIGTNPDNIAPAFGTLLSGNWKKGGIPELWDGKAAERIVEVLRGL